MSATAFPFAAQPRRGSGEELDGIGPARPPALAMTNRLSDAGRLAASGAEVQKIVAPGGEILVVMSLAHYRRLTRTRADGDGVVPLAVREAIELGETPLAAWRRHRGYSQTRLAAIAAVSRATINRLEQRTAGAGHRESRARLARALDIPLGAL